MVFHFLLILKNKTTLEQEFLQNYNPFDKKSKLKNYEDIMQCKLFSVYTFIPINIKNQTINNN